MKLSNLAGKLRKHGLTVVETPGWSNRGFLGRDLLEVRGVLWHHTATNRVRFNGSNAPTLQMCIEGRPDVSGPLCQIVFGRDGTVYLTAAGLANHAGAGSAPGIPRDMGNYHLVGIEMESSGVAPWDWTLDQLRVAPHLGAALELELLQHLPAERRLQIGHLEYSSQGKIDPAGWPGGMDGLRSSINRVLAAGGTINVASSGGSKPAPAPAPKPTKKGEQVPKHTRIYPPAVTRNLGAGVEWFLKDRTGKRNLNLAGGTGGLGHYDVDLFVQGSGLAVGEVVEVQFYLVKGGKRSGYFTQQIHGTESGDFKGSARFKMPLDESAAIEVGVKASAGCALEVYGADVYNWQKEG
ncbi:endolysin [Arthrobacter phage Kepler]|uniref:Endolysin n=1 Tax=Arthrobacter phage Kepler TaxID=2419959 RepID=A0A3G2KH20_9CAUD|nr:endolysin [Arthrobacter phage Kepler]AYN58251.1 endolysin [Arthrobacter phage Kepler]